MPMKKDSTASLASSHDELVMEGAKRALATSKGITRVPLEDLGPALFNRLGAPTSGRHCMNLAKRIIAVEGFATQRYTAGFCHEPDPDKPLSVSSHGNGMATRDPLLPRVHGKALKGVFAKTHLVTLLLLYKQGCLPDLQRMVARQPGHARFQELQEALSQGIFMHIFPFEAVRDHLDDFKCLMASDNFDHAYGMTGSEIRCISVIRELIRNMEVPKAMSQFVAVTSEITKLSTQRWGAHDLEAFWDFAQTTLELQMEMLGEVWVFGECEDMLYVDSHFWGALAKLPAARQWTRAAVAVSQFLSDREAECILVGGRFLACAVDKNTLKRLGATNRTEEQKAISQDMEEFMCAVMDTYYVPWSSHWDDSPFQRNMWAKAFAAFLCKMGRFVCRDAMLSKETKEKLQTKLRSTLAVDMHGEMPGVVSTASSHGQAPKEMETVVQDGGNSGRATVPVKRLALEDQTPKVMETVVQDGGNPGRATVPVKRLALEAGFLLDGMVAKKTPKTTPASSQAEASGQATASSEIRALGKIIRIDNDGIHVMWTGGELRHTQEELVPAVPPREKEKSLPARACKWAACSSDDNAKMWVHMAQSVLYHTYLSQSSAHGDVHVALVSNQEEGAAGQDKVCLFAARDHKPRSLLLLPFNQPLVSGDVPRPSGAVKAQLTVWPTQEQPVSESWWIRSKAQAKGVQSFTQGEKAVALIPFWTAVARASSQDDAEDPMHNMQYATAIIQIPTPPPVSKGVRVHKGRMTLKVLCLTNNDAISKGTNLMVAGKPPAGEFPVDNVMGVEEATRG